MTHYKNHSIEIQDTADASATIIGSITQADLPIDSEVLREETGGSVYPDQLSVVSQKPRVTFTTYDLPKVIDAFGLVGRLMTEDTGKVGFQLYQSQYSDGGTIVSGANHRGLQFPYSFGRINTISVSHRQDATVESEVVAIYDKSSDPIVIQASQALPTLPTSPGRWTLYSLDVGRQSIGCKTQLDIDFGFSVDAYGCDDDIWDTHMDVSQISPTVTITSLDPTNFSDSKVALEGLKGTHANSKIVLKKRTPSQATYIDDATAEHIEITFAGVILATSAHSASGNAKGQSTFRIDVDYDGTNAPFVFDTAYPIV